MKTHLIGGTGLLVLAFSAFAARPVVVQEGKLGQDWKIADGHSLAAPGYPASGSENANVCINMGYAVSPDGSVKDLVVLKSWGSASNGSEMEDKDIEPFAQSAALAVSSWRFAPKAHVEDPVRTVTSTTLTFINGKAQAEVRGHCAITDLAAFLEESRATFRRGESMRASDLDSNYRAMDRQQRQNNASRLMGNGAR